MSHKVASTDERSSKVRTIPDWPRICGGKRVNTSSKPLSWQLQVPRSKLHAMQAKSNTKWREYERQLNKAPPLVPINQFPSKFKLCIQGDKE